MKPLEGRSPNGIAAVEAVHNGHKTLSQMLGAIGTAPKRNI